MQMEVPKIQQRVGFLILLIMKTITIKTIDEGVSFHNTPMMCRNSGYKDPAPMMCRNSGYKDQTPESITLSTQEVA